MSDTPRTDACVASLIRNGKSPEALEYFARELERENAKLTAELEIRTRQRDWWMDDRCAWKLRAKKAEAEVERLRSVMCHQGKRDAISAQIGAPFDEDLHDRMGAGHA